MRNSNLINKEVKYMSQRIVADNKIQFYKKVLALNVKVFIVKETKNEVIGIVVYVQINQRRR